MQAVGASAELAAGDELDRRVVGVDDRVSVHRKAGYQMMHSEAHHSFGHDLVGEVWELTL